MRLPALGLRVQGTTDLGVRGLREVFEAGDAFYAPPGHTPRAEAGAEFVQFSPTAELEVVQRAMMDNMRRMSAG